MVKAMREMDNTLDFAATPTEAQAAIYLDGFAMLLPPMLDGIFRDGAQTITQAISEALNLHAKSALYRRVDQRLQSVSV